MTVAGYFTIISTLFAHCTMLISAPNKKYSNKITVLSVLCYIIVCVTLWSLNMYVNNKIFQNVIFVFYLPLFVHFITYCMLSKNNIWIKVFMFFIYTIYFVFSIGVAQYVGANLKIAHNEVYSTLLSFVLFAVLITIYISKIIPLVAKVTDYIPKSWKWLSCLSGFFSSYLLV